jgi:protein-S-isoprenylcysteine O-methyltransferase Ste14
MTFTLLTLNLLLHSAFIWGRFAVFRVNDRFSSGALVQTSALLCIFLDAVLILRRTGSNNSLDPLAIAVSAISGILFVWAVRTTGLKRLSAIFSEDLPAEIVVAGPFRFVRNPFYLAYLLAYFQALIASRSWWAACPIAVMGSLYLRAALLEEEKFQGSPLAPQYLRYRGTTGRFLPRFVLGAGSRRALSEIGES